MGISDIFRFGSNAQSAQPAPSAIPNTALSQGLPANLPPMMQPQGGNPMAPGAQGEPQTQEKSPFAEFEKLWDTPKPVDGQIQDEPIRFNIDASKVQQSAKQIDFTKTVTPALLERINAGGEGAMQAMMQAMNEMGQTIFAQSMMAGTRVLENGLETSHQRLSRTLPETIRKQNVSTTLRESNPLFSNPATAPMLKMLESQLTSQFPTATPQQIAEHARNYLVSFAGEAAKLNPETQAQASFQAGREIDWSQIPT